MNGAAREFLRAYLWSLSWVIAAMTTLKWAGVSGLPLYALSLGVAFVATGATRTRFIRRRIELWRVRYCHAAPHVNEDGNLTFASTDGETVILTIVEEKSDGSHTAHLRIESRTLILGRPMTRFDGSWRL